jgi:hypothetical protein
MTCLVRPNYPDSSELRISQVALRDDYVEQPLRDNPLRQRPSEVGEDPHSVLGVFSFGDRPRQITMASAAAVPSETR